MQTLLDEVQDRRNEKITKKQYPLVEVASRLGKPLYMLDAIVCY